MESPTGFAPPGPGSWSLDTAHFPRPVTRFVADAYTAPARAGFQEATAHYGLLLDHIAWAFVARWAYLSPRPVWARDGVGATPESEGEWQSLVARDDAVAARLAASETVFPERRWRADVHSWDARVKPEMIRGHRELQAVVLDDLDEGALLEHIGRCRSNLERAIRTHHRFGVAFAIPAGDFLARASEWTGAPPSDLLVLLRHGEAGATAELAALAGAVTRDRRAAALLSQDAPAGEILASLRAVPGGVGRAAASYLDLVSWWSTGGGADVGEPCLVEMPEVLLEAIRAAVGVAEAQGPEASGDHAGAPVPAGAEPAGDDAGGRVSPGARRDFDHALEEARAAHRLRDERALFCDVWAFGLSRRALLEMGRRLAAAGRIEDARHLVEAGHEEIVALVAEGGPSAAELARRAAYRAEADAESTPPVLGGGARRPVPLEWLPAGVARTERAFRTYMAAMSERDRAGSAEDGRVRGIGASAGRYRGRARVVAGAGELGRVRRGDVLVVASTTPAFNPVLPLVGAVVTDRGGLLSHAAIVAREYGVPAVVGTGDATRRIADGAVVVVDGGEGEVTIVAGPR